jgi:hypothetical protein
MPIDLPPNSLGPTPTKKQMELLRKMAAPGAVVHIWHGIRSNGGAYIKFDVPGKHETEKVNQGDVHKFCDWGWLESIGGDYNGHNYRVSDRGRKVIEKGVTR